MQPDILFYSQTDARYPALVAFLVLDGKPQYNLIFRGATEDAITAEVEDFWKKERPRALAKLHRDEAAEAARAGAPEAETKVLRDPTPKGTYSAAGLKWVVNKKTQDRQRVSADEAAKLVAEQGYTYGKTL